MVDHPRVVAYVLTRNEAANIRRVLTSLQRVTDEVLVVDSESTDATRSIANELDARVVVHPFEGFSSQRNWALSYIAEHYDADYVLNLDADESLSDDLVDDLQSRFVTGRLTEDVYLLNLRVQFDGRVLRWGGFANTWLPRLFKPDVAEYELRAVNEHVSLSHSASIGRLRGWLLHHDVKSWKSYIEKHNSYSSLEAQARVEIRQGAACKTSFGEAVRRPYLRRRWLRQTVWDRLPARPALRFVHVYIVAGGLLDGRAGFRRALFESWQEMCTDIKAEEMMRDPAFRRVATLPLASTLNASGKVR
jgi:Glycosyl transferase family 2